MVNGAQKLAVIVYRTVHGTAPRYLSDLLHRVSDSTLRCRLRSSTSSELVIPLLRLVNQGHYNVYCIECHCCKPSVIVHLLLPAPGSGTLCLRTLYLRRLYLCSDEN